MLAAVTTKLCYNSVWFSIDSEYGHMSVGDWHWSVNPRSSIEARQSGTRGHDETVLARRRFFPSHLWCWSYSDRAKGSAALQAREDGLRELEKSVTPSPTLRVALKKKGRQAFRSRRLMLTGAIMS